MFINISSDRIFFVHEDKRIELPFGDLEKNLPAFLYWDFSRALWIKSTSAQPSPSDHIEIVVLHWPWSFTNIRIGTLALNTYTMLHSYQLEFLNINKLQRYRALYIQKKIPQICVMFIGQKKNYRIVDLEKIHIFLTKNPDFDWNWKESLAQLLHECVEKTSLVAYIQERENGDHNEQIFFDEVVAEWKDAIQNACEMTWIEPFFYRFVEGDIDSVVHVLREKWWLQKEKLLSANYMIEANVS